MQGETGILSVNAGPWGDILVSFKVFRKERKEERGGSPYFYLAVSTDCTTWAITDSLDSKSGYMQSSSAGAACPASPSNAINARKHVGRKSWLFFDGKGKLQEGGIQLCCDMHRFPKSQQPHEPCTGISVAASSV